MNSSTFLLTYSSFNDLMKNKNGDKIIIPNKRVTSEPKLIQKSEVVIPIFIADSNGSVELSGFKNNSGKLGTRLNPLKALQNLTEAGVKSILLKGKKFMI